MGRVIRLVQRNAGHGRHRARRGFAGVEHILAFERLMTGQRLVAGDRLVVGDRVEAPVGGSARCGDPPVGARPSGASLPVRALPSAGADPNALSAALAGLDAELRQALVESYFQGRTVNEAAAVLDLPVATVKARVYAALQALQRAITS